MNELITLQNRRTELLRLFVSEEDLRKVLKDKKKPIVYCGYEPNGPMHLGHFVTITKLIDF